MIDRRAQCFVKGDGFPVGVCIIVVDVRFTLLREVDLEKDAHVLILLTGLISNRYINCTNVSQHLLPSQYDDDQNITQRQNQHRSGPIAPPPLALVTS